MLVLGFTSLPAPLLHKVFADHTDAQENHCRFYHKDLGRHVEQQEDHCDIFNANTPLYDAVKISHDFTSFATIISECKNTRTAALPFFAPLDLPARAPPIA